MRFRLETIEEARARGWQPGEGFRMVAASGPDPSPEEEARQATARLQATTRAPSPQTQTTGRKVGRHD
jgi:hypothetical protein